MIEKILLEKTAEALKKLYGAETGTESVGLEKTKKEIEGDFTIVVFPFTRFSRRSPEATAQEIGEFLKKEIREIRETRIIKGFLNLILEDGFWTRFLSASIHDPSFGFSSREDTRPVLIEYSSPNTNKPLHLGHIRNNLLGYSLAEILKANGHPVIRLNLVNDRGIHICKSMLAYQKWGNGETPESSGLKSDHLIGKYYVLFERKYREEVNALVQDGKEMEEAEKQAPLINEAQEVLRKWESGDPGIRTLWKQMNQWAYHGFEETYRRLGVAFDRIQYESDTYLVGKELVTGGVEKGHLVRKEDGSIWADLTSEGLDEKVLQRSDGTSVYMTQDLGTAVLRYNEYCPSEMIYVVGNEQNYHFDVLKRILKKLGYEWSGRIFHLSYGMVELPQGRMKSREGTIVDADDLMDEMYRTAEKTTRELGKASDFPQEEAGQLFRTIGLGALKYYILKVDPKKNMLFNPEESIDFNGNTGPFIQYTYARIQSLLQKAKEAGISGDLDAASSYSLLDIEKRIIRLIYFFPEVVREAGEELSPALIANHAYELAKEYNQFYQEIPVLKAETGEQRDLRLLLSAFTGDVIRRSMALLGIGVPSRM
jgi:arginyl-tRNA synthetase